MSYIGNSPGVASQRVTTTLTATAAQTQFTTQSGYVLGYVDVYLNGAKLVNGSDFEAITGTYITLFAGAVAGDIIELISYVPRGLTDGYTKAEADSKFLDVGGDTATGNLAFATATLSGNLTLNGGTANGVGYLNGSKVVTTGSALTFDGTILATPTLNLTNALGIAYGGTGQTTANAALNALLPAQTGNATKYLQTDGTNTTWDAISISTADITGTLPVANGGTGATTAAGALTSLGAYAASNPSGYTTNLGTVTSVGGTGTVNGLTLTGTVSTTGNLTLGGTLDLSAYSAAGAFSTLTASGAVTLSGGTANGVPYLNASKVLTSGSALTFDGSTTLTLTTANTTATVAKFRGTNYGNLGTTYVSIGTQYDDGSSRIGSSNPTGNQSVLVFETNTATSGVYQEGFRLTNTSLYTATNINVGIGTSSTTSARLTVSTPNDLVFVATSSTTGNTNFRVSNTAAGGSNFDFASGSTGHYLFGYGTIPLVFGTNGTTRASISSDGNFFISSATTNTNSSKLVVGGTISQTVGGNQYLVVDQSDIGTAPNQIPLNQHLGSLAFQDRENINFTGGTGALSSLDIAAVSAQLNVSAVDVFVYDTSKDSDGGAWRKRTQHTSWYNEPLNTATRGSRREFPAVAVIVVTGAYVSIHDGDDPTLPMWMGFADASYASQLWETNPTCTAALNAKVVVGCNPYDLYVLDFVADKSVSHSNNSAISGTHKYPISGRAPATGSYSAPADIWNFGTVPDIARRNIYDVAMTVLPNAPVDPATGLPVPTIAVATDVGVSVIKDNGTVTNLGWSGAALRLSGFNSDNAFCAIYNNGNTIYNVKYKPPYNTQDTSESYYYNLAVAVNPSLPWNPTNEKPLWARKNEYVIGTTGVLRYLGEGRDSDVGTRIYNVQTSTYNSGYMVGDIKGAWLSDTTQEIVAGTELITNSTFDSSTAGWSNYPGYTGTVLSIDTNRLKVFGGGAQQSFSTVIGKRYVLTYTLTAFNPGGVYLGTAASGAAGFSYFSTGSQSTGTYSYTFTATSTIAYLGLFAWNAASEYAFYDNVSVRLAEADRSPNAKGLQVFGTITKTPVAAGADLVGYSGFSMTGTSGSYINYLKAQNSVNIGTSDFCYIFWIKTTNDGNQQSIYNSMQADGLSAGPYISQYTDGGLYMGIFQANAANPVISPYNNGKSIADNTWHQICFVKSGTNIKHYIDGVLANTADNMYATVAPYDYAEFGVGYRPFVGSLSLFRFSLTAPNADQVLKMYNDEKVLFQPNAKATLYGTSDAVTALAYDTDTQLLHVGTSAGRSVFDGLRRVDNTTTGVSATISAVDGLIAEN